jgi:hypothetical protein
VDGVAGGRPPYGAVLLILGATGHPSYRSYIRGKLALAGVDLNAPLPVWLDASWAAYLDAPHALIEDAARELVLGAARLRPDRETWGLRPEHRALAGGFAGQKPA